MKLSEEEYKYFLDTAEEILKNEDFISSKNNIQHGKISVYEHSYNVALKSYSIALRRKKYDLKSLIRGALLHDFFLYDWHILNGRKRFHGFHHAKTALRNASAQFTLNSKEKNIIKSHMWPLTFFSFPKSKEAWLVVKVDKMVSVADMKGKEDVLIIWKS